MENKNYNGWTNYETWCVNLWLDNDQGMYESCLDMAEEALRDEMGNNRDRDDSIPPTEEEQDDAASALAGTLKDMIEEQTPELGGMFADLMNAALSEVNWREIAVALIETATERF